MKLETTTDPDKKNMMEKIIVSDNFTELEQFRRQVMDRTKRIYHSVGLRSQLFYQIIICTDMCS